MDRLGCSRRTAERHRALIEEIWGAALEEMPGDSGREKRWRLDLRSARFDSPIAPEDLTALSLAREKLVQEGLEERAAALQRIETLLVGLLPKQRRARFAPDWEALLQGEGWAARPQPHLDGLEPLLTDIRTGLKACRKLRFRYVSRFTGRTSRQTVAPYGVLYGVRHYLVAYNDYAETFWLYSLAEIEDLEVLDEGFVRDPDFSLAAFAARSFGVFQEEPQDILWWVSPLAAAEARRTQFHPTQVVEECPDGSLHIRFRAGGLLEMAWYLLTWHGAIRVLEPPALRSMVERVIEEAAVCLCDPN
jgi:predicted DNA-binding transcriptional regulator YafY